MCSGKNTLHLHPVSCPAVVVVVVATLLLSLNGVVRHNGVQ